jgi:hypothetical protein
MFDTDRRTHDGSKCLLYLLNDTTQDKTKEELEIAAGKRIKSKFEISSINA